ncbi:hypothetical protein BDV12DRAFT_142806 [Aspergillus spectabilis]
MGQGSSQVAQPLPNGEHENDESDDNTRTIKPPSSLPKPSKKKEPQQKTETQLKRKRQSSQGDSRSLAAASPERSSDVKRKRLVDSLEKNDALVSNRKPEPKSSNSRKKSIKPTVEGPVSIPSPTPLNRANVAPRSGDKISPSPALATGDRQAKGRLNRSDGSTTHRGSVGAFKPAEVEALEAFKVEFCNSNSCTAMMFDLMVQHGRDGPFPAPNGVTKLRFWRQARSTLPGRDRRSIYRFMKRHFFVPGQKPHEWTEEQEDELVVMYHQHGPKWVYIGEQLGRGSDDVVQRWKNHLEHRGTMNVGVWTEAELEGLKNTLRSVWEKLRAEGYDVGRHPYEMDESLISWGQVSAGMQHRRSRQQCADKWRRLKHNAFVDSRSNSRSDHGSKSRSATPATTSQGKKMSPRSRNALSDKYVISDAGDSDEEDSTHERSKTPAKSNPPDGSSSGQKRKRPDTSSSSSSDSNSASESSEDDDTNPAAQTPKTSKATKVTKENSSSSSEDSEDSDSTGESDGESESESESENDDKPASSTKSKAIVARKESATESETSSGSDSTGESDGQSESDGEPASNSKSKALVVNKESTTKSDTSSDSDAETDSSDSSSETNAKINNAPIKQQDSEPKTSSRRYSSSSSSRNVRIKKENSDSESDSRNSISNGPKSAFSTANIRKRDKTSDASSSEDSSSCGSESESDSE